MEQAVNTFEKGLQMDTNPMMLSNNSLTDALNATFVTMNGNELVMQNDMGNRRIDNVFLPSGYEPVGIKEHGGIIYVASYNPITNKSQIGSFPSPERKIDASSDLEGNIDLDDILQNNNIVEINYLNDLPCLKHDSILYPLTNDISLHAGDKFVVYTTNNELDQLLISNFNNTYNGEKKVFSPKNKKYTLSLGVLNSKNEFIDITKSLVRWDGINNEPISYTNESDLYKFNDGYFIKPNTYSPPNISGNDKQLILERQTILANTYAYKLVGPLYLKQQLNHIQLFTYNIYGTKIESQNEDEEGTIRADIVIEAFVEYNCPDGITYDSSPGDDNYLTYSDDVSPTINMFNLLDKNLNLKTSLGKFWITFNNNRYMLAKNESIDIIIDTDNIELNTKYLSIGYYRTDPGSDKIYNPKVKITEINEEDNSLLKCSVETFRDNWTTPEQYFNSNIIDYEAEKIKYSPESDLYSCKIIKRYNNIISDENGIFEYIIGVIGNDDDENKIYLSELSVKDSLDFKLLGSGIIEIIGWRFRNSKTEKSSYIIYDLRAYPKYGEEFINGKLIFTNVKDSNDIITINNITLNNGRNVLDILWDNVGINPRKMYTVELQYDISSGRIPGNFEKRWFLSTELFNDWFDPNSEVFTKDYSNPDSTNYENKKLIDVDYSVNLDISNYYKSVDEISGNDVLVSTSNTSGTTGYKTTQYKKLIPNKEISELENYPDYITLKETAKNGIQYKLDNNQKIELVAEGLLEDESCEINNINELVVENTDTIEWTRLELTTIENLFVPLYEIASYLEPSVSNMLVLDYGDTSSGNWTEIKTDNNNNIKTVRTTSNGDETGVKLYKILTKHNIDYSPETPTHTININLIYNSMCDRFNQEISKDVIFAYGFFNNINNVHDDHILISNYWFPTNTAHDDPVFSEGVTLGITDVFDHDWNGNKATHFRGTFSNARIWWRTSNGKWALFNNLIGLDDNGNVMFTEFIENNITNIFFAYYKSFNVSGLYIADDITTRYIERNHDLKVNAKFTAKIDDMVDISLQDISSSEYPIFKTKSGNPEVDVYIDKLSSLVSMNISNSLEIIELSDLIDTHSLNKYLYKDEVNNVDTYNVLLDSDPNTIYYKQNEKLKVWENCPIKVYDDDSFITGRKIVYNDEVKGEPIWRYDMAEHNLDSYIDYKDVNIVLNVKINV